MLDHDNKCFVIPRELSKGGKSERTILLNNEAYNIVKDKTGFVFTNTKGRPWKAKSIHSKCWHLSKTLGFPITLGTLRHVFITDALVNGVDPISLSKIVGHKDLKMIQGVYSKLEKRTDHLRKALNRAVKGV
jgi:integrase